MTGGRGGARYGAGRPKGTKQPLADDHKKAIAEGQRRRMRDPAVRELQSENASRGNVKAWETRRARYGPSGTRPRKPEPGQEDQEPGQGGLTPQGQADTAGPPEPSQDGSGLHYRSVTKSGAYGRPGGRPRGSPGGLHLDSTWSPAGWQA
jgi:hypothetical protein